MAKTIRFYLKSKNTIRPALLRTGSEDAPLSASVPPPVTLACDQSAWTEHQLYTVVYSTLATLDVNYTPPPAYKFLTYTAAIVHSHQHQLYSLTAPVSRIRHTAHHSYVGPSVRLSITPLYNNTTIQL